jgi:hypothetical protein
MNHCQPVKALLLHIVPLLAAGFMQLHEAKAQFAYFTPVIPERGPDGVALPGGNTTFADGSVFIPGTDAARSSKWTWRAQGAGFVLSSLGPASTTPPTETKELATTVQGLKPGAKYAAYVLFWSTDPGMWSVRAGLVYGQELRTNVLFTNGTPGVILATYLPWETMPPIFEDGGRPLFAGSLGTSTTSATGSLTIYVHDLPTGDSGRRTWYQGVAVAEVVEPSTSKLIDLGAAGAPFDRGVRGLAISDMALDRGEYWVGVPTSLEVARGSSIRGVATGLAADIYDWRTRNGQPRPATLQFLRYSRDYASELWMGLNMRGLIEPDPAGGWQYYDTNVSTVATMAAEWVRYANHIVPNYRQGDMITDPRDAAILNSLIWSSAFPGDAWDKLQPSAEAAVPQVAYWEIGNEPTYGVSAYSVKNSFTLNPANYLARYKAIALAVKAENLSAKVGPTIVHAEREEDHLAALVADPEVPMDFLTYHPYERMGRLDDPVLITLHLGSVYSRQKRFLSEIKRVVAENGRNPEALEYAATEVNVSSWDTNDTDKEARIAHALGTVETIFTHARLGLKASMYWIWPTHRWDGTRYPVFKAYEKLRDHMGDTLVGMHLLGDIRIYITRDSRTGELAIWGLNFSNAQDVTAKLQLQNLPPIHQASLMRLQALAGKTTLFSANLSSEMGGPAINVDWLSTSLSAQSLSDLDLSLPAATLTLVVIKPGIEGLTPTMVEESGQRRIAISFARLPYASDVKYRLLRSHDLQTWQFVQEVQTMQSELIQVTDAIDSSSTTPWFYRVELAVP